MPRLRFSAVWGLLLLLLAAMARGVKLADRRSPG